MKITVLPDDTFWYSMLQLMLEYLIGLVIILLTTWSLSVLVAELFLISEPFAKRMSLNSTLAVSMLLMLHSVYGWSNRTDYYTVNIPV